MTDDNTIINEHHFRYFVVVPHQDVVKYKVIVIVNNLI